ncbi:MAG: hypothetical protein GC147_08950 [Porphyrobacter sp.]|nr:hypothetical protein [Porphyrobacter sp.]
MLSFRFSSLLGRTPPPPAMHEPPAEAPVAEAQAGAESAREGLRGDIDQALITLATARKDAEQLETVVARLEVEAARVPALAEENRDLGRRVKARDAEIVSLKADEERARRELGRAREALARAEVQREALEAERRDLLKDGAEGRARIVALGETVVRLEREIERAEAVRGKAESEIAGLRTALAERERAHDNLRAELSALRFAAARDQRCIAQLGETVREKDERIAELAGALHGAEAREEELGASRAALEERLRASETRATEQRIALEAQIAALDLALAQERADHARCRHLLEEDRAAMRALAEENRLHKDKAVSLAQAFAQIKSELGATQADMCEHSLRLAEARAENRELAARLEAVAEAERDADRLRRRIETLGAMCEELREGTGGASAAACEVAVNPAAFGAAAR